MFVLGFLFVDKLVHCLIYVRKPYIFGIPNTLFGIPNTYLEFKIPYSEFQIRIWNSKYIFRIPNTVFGIPNRVFGIPNTYLEFQIRYSEFQIRIWNSKYPIRNSKYVFGIPNNVFGIPNREGEIFKNSKYVFGIPNSIFHILNFEFGWRFQAFVFMTAAEASVLTFLYWFCINTKFNHILIYPVCVSKQNNIPKPGCQVDPCAVFMCVQYDVFLAMVAVAFSPLHAPKV